MAKKRVRAEDTDDDVTDNQGSSQPPAKSLRVIDLTYKTQSEPEVPNFDRLTLTNEENQKEESDAPNHDDKEIAGDNNFYYDLYAVTTNFNNATEDDTIKDPFEEGIFEADSDDFDDWRLDDGEDSDSNSESNWRNDYPDEEDFDISEDDLFDEYGFRDGNSDSDDFANYF